MRKNLALWTVVAVAFIGLSTVQVTTAPPAEAHGSCSAPAYRPARQASQVRFQGVIDCVELHCDLVAITVQAWRRTPNGTWNLITTAFAGDPPSPQCTDINFTNAYVNYDCHKDYQTRTIGRAEPGSHVPHQSSNILPHSC
jgi:hypothetical protein